MRRCIMPPIGPPAAWRLKVLRLDQLRELAALTARALAVAALLVLAACGGGDPEPDDERVRIPTRPSSEAAQ